jgi:hypothetical protein
LGDYTGESEIFDSFDAESAAEAYAELSDIESADYSIVAGQSEIVRVIDEPRR